MQEQLLSRREARPSYENAFCRASQKTFELLACIESERKVVPDHLIELLALRRPEREKALRSDPRFHSYPLATYALESSEQEVSRDPVKAWELARLGRSIVRHIDPRTCGGMEALADLEACALATEGNSLRVRGAFKEAFNSFACARAVQRQGGVDPDLTATIDLMESSLRRDSWQLDTALALLDRATEVFLSLEEHHRVTQALLNRANIYIVKGDRPTAIAILRSALDWTLDLSFTLVVRHNLADALVKAGRAPEAARIFLATQDLYDRCTDILTTNRRRWLEGLIARELGDDLQHAYDLLELATENFVAHGYAHDAALAQLDLMATRTRLKNSRRLRNERVPHPLHSRVAPTQQHADPAAAEATVGKSSGQTGGSRGLHHHA